MVDSQHTLSYVAYVNTTGKGYDMPNIYEQHCAAFRDVSAPRPDLSPRGWNGGPVKYGASMGRPSYADIPHQGRIALRRIRLDAGGYDSGGAYWGHGEALYWAGSGCKSIDMFFRAPGRDAAKARVRETCPGATFYR